MALVAEVTRDSVKQLNSFDYNIVIRVIVKDESETVLMDNTYSTRYYDQTEIGDIRTALQNLIKADWDKYIHEKTLLDSAAFDSMCNNIQSAFNNYINS